MYMWISTRPPRHPCLCSYLWYTRTVAPPLQGVVIKLWQKKPELRAQTVCKSLLSRVVVMSSTSYPLYYPMYLDYFRV